MPEQSPVILSYDRLDAAEEMATAVEILSRGGLALFPTDTVYGIGCRADSQEAVERVYLLKKRSKDLALPILIADPEDFWHYGLPNAEALALAEESWPGALTLIVEAKDRLAENLSPWPSLGFRCPDAPVLRELMRRLGSPLAATSANLSGSPEVLSPGELPDGMRYGVDLILEGGRLERRRPSRVVDCSVSPPRVLRD